MNTLIACTITVMVMISSTSGADLTTYRWKNRLLLVFSPTAADPGFAAFNLNLSENRHGVDDRDLIVYRIFEKGSSSLAEQPLSMDDAEVLRRNFGVKTGRFTVILIGKDGGIKMVREDRAGLQAIFDLIDSMPMRQQEMMERGKTR